MTTASLDLSNAQTWSNNTLNPLTISSNVTMLSGAAVTLSGLGPTIVNGSVSMSGNRSINSSTSANSVINGIVSGSTFTFTKFGFGNLTLAGANTYTATALNGGNLIFDYAANSVDPLPSSQTLTLNQGNAALRGRAGSVVTDTLATAAFGPAVGADSNLTLNANGGPGIGLTISVFQSTTSLVSNFIDLSSSASNSLTITGFGASGQTASVGTDNVLISGNTTSTNRRATTIVRDATGYGFAKTATSTGGLVTRLTTGTTLDASVSSATTNYRLTNPGTLTRTAALDFQTLTIDSAAGAVVLDMANSNLLFSGVGRGILLTGNNDISITSTGSGTIAGSTSAYTYNYTSGAAVVTIGVPTVAGTGAYVYGGTGNYNYAASFAAVTQGYHFHSGNTRLTAAQNLNGLTSVPFVVAGGGVLEIGADLNGATAGDFTLTLKDYASSSSGITLYGDAGLSAFGANRLVNFGGATGLITWGSAGFLTTIGTPVDAGGVFKLSSTRSDSTIEIRNPINLGTASRVVDVANGSAVIDALLSGNLSGTAGSTAPAFTKNGLGMLVLSGDNAFSGVTTVNAGTLAVTGTMQNNGAANYLVAAPDDTLAGNAVLTRRVLAAASYTLGSATGLGATAISIDPVTSTSFNTTAAILAGTASSQADVSMQWRTRSVAESSGDNAILSDVVNLTGVAVVGASTDVFLLEMSYTDAALAALGMNEAAYAANGTLRLGWFNGSLWTSAVDGNSLASVKTFVGNQSSAAFLTSLGAAPLSSKLGSYGVDTANNKVWAVLDHNSEFAVIPEPSTLIVGSVFALGLLTYRMRRRKISNTV